MSDMTWVREDTPRWDGAKQRLFGPAELASVGLAQPAPDSVLADEWWRVADPSGAVVGYGWLDAEWGDAEIRFVVAPDRRGERIGEFIVDRLEREAAARGLNYIYNSVPATHPDRDWMSEWLVAHGFQSRRGTELRRRVRST